MSETIAFGTDGIRGPAGVWPIVPAVARRVGAAAAELARRQGGLRVGIGRDPRPSGEALAAAVAAGVIDAGGLPRDAGVVPTSAIQLAVDAGLVEAGVVLTASHNPGGDNGFKVICAGGRKPDDVQAEEISGWLSGEALPERTGAVEDARGPVVALWLERVSEAIARDREVFGGRRVAIDLANGATSSLVGELARLLPDDLAVDWLGIGGGVNDGCGSEHIEHLAERIRRTGADGGFAVDGDGDRCRVVDEAGGVVPGDAVTWRLARDGGVSGLAVTIMSNGALERSLPGVRVVRTPVGDRHLRKAMDEHGLPLGAEESGHVLFGGFPGGDGLLAGLRSLAAAWRGDGALSAAFAGFRPLPRRLTRAAVGVRRPLGDLAELQRVQREGLGRLGPDGRILLRYSGTEPVLRILVEGEGEAEVAAVSAAVTAAAVAGLS